MDKNRAASMCDLISFSFIFNSSPQKAPAACHDPIKHQEDSKALKAIMELQKASSNLYLDLPAHSANIVLCIAHTYILMLSLLSPPLPPFSLSPSLSFSLSLYLYLYLSIYLCMYGSLYLYFVRTYMYVNIVQVCSDVFHYAYSLY